MSLVPLISCQHYQKNYRLWKYSVIAIIIMLILGSIIYYYISQKNYEEVFKEVLEKDNKDLCYKLNEELIPSCIAHYYSNKAVQTRNISLCNQLPSDKVNSCLLYYAMETGECDVLNGDEKEACINLQKKVKK